MDKLRVLGITDILSSGACLEYDVPLKLRDGVASYLKRCDAGEDDPVKPRLSSTVMLLRDKAPASSGFQVFMQQRASTMAFVPDAVVFPGGSFDPIDDAHDVPWEGPSVSEWASLMGCDEQTARRALVTAAREVFEETGVLLARKANGADFEDPMKSPELRQAREQLSEHALSFGQMLEDIGGVLWTDLLHACAHWVTPPSERRRYSTFFFRARKPQSQVADGRTTEAVKTGWADPLWLLDQHRSGKLLIMPPTVSNLCDLAASESVAQACERNSTIHVRPFPARKSDGTLVFRSVIG